MVSHQRLNKLDRPFADPIGNRLGIWQQLRLGNTVEHAWKNCASEGVSRFCLGVESHRGE